MTQPGKGSAWLLGKLRKGQVWCALLSLALSLSLASAADSAWRAAASQPAQLEDRAIDPMLVDDPAAVEDSSPSAIFYLALAGAFLAFFLLFSLINGWVARGLLGEAMDKEKSGILLLSQFSLALYALGLIAGSAVPESLRTIVHLVCGLLMLSMIAKYLVAVDMRSDRKWTLVWSLLSDDQLMLAALFMPAAVISVVGLLGGSLLPLAGRSALLISAVYLGVLVFGLVGYWLIAGRIAGEASGGVAVALYDLNTAVIIAGAPLILIPLGVLVANEIQSSVPAADPRVLGLVVAGTLAVASVAVFVLHRRGFLRLGGREVVVGFYYPALIATLASYRTHVWTRRLGTLDYFRTGEQVLPAQQLWEFGSLPLLDLLPSRGLADAGVQSLFALINGIGGLDMLVWLPWIPVVVGFLVIYAFLAVITSPLLALLLTILMPVQAAIVGQYAVVLVPACILVWTLRRPEIPRFLALWLIAAGLLAWRPQLGWPAILATLVVVVLVVLLENRAAAGPAFLSLAIVLGLVPAGLLVAEVVWDGDTSVALAGFLGLLSDDGARRFGTIATSSGAAGAAGLLQQFLPILAILCLLYFCLRQFIRQQPFTATGYALLYLVVFSLILPVRAVVIGDRSFFDPSLLLLTLALIPFLVTQRPFRPRQIGRSTWVLSTLVFCALLGPIDIYHLVGGNRETRTDLRTWEAGERRVLYDPQPHGAVVEFLRRELEEGQSFFDFTGSPALYALAGKGYPLRSISDLRRTSESLQRSQIDSLEDLRQAGQLPLVLFRSPPRLARSRQHPPAEALSYRLAEYVYSHYLPWVRVDGWQIWRERGAKRGKPMPPAKSMSPTSVRQNFLLGNLPRRWAERDPWQSVSRTDVLDPVLEQQILLRPGAPTPLLWQPAADFPVATYLHIRARPLGGSHANLTVSYGSQPQSSFEFRLSPSIPAERDSNESVRLDLKEDHKKHALHRVARYPDRFVFRSTGKDPWLQKFADLSSVPKMAAGSEQWVTIRYRSEMSGEAQVFFTKQGKAFREGWSARFPVIATGGDSSVRVAKVPVLGLREGDRLSNLRLDPPSDCEFEVVGVQLIQRPMQSEDYLVRMTTQFHWATGSSQPLVLSSDSQILIDGVYLRAGD